MWQKVKRSWWSAKHQAKKLTEGKQSSSFPCFWNFLKLKRRNKTTFLKWLVLYFKSLTNPIILLQLWPCWVGRREAILDLWRPATLSRPSKRFIRLCSTKAIGSSNVSAHPAADCFWRLNLIVKMKLHLFLEYYKKNTTEEEETLIRVPLSSLVTICALKQAKCLENFSTKYIAKNLHSQLLKCCWKSLIFGDTLFEIFILCPKIQLWFPEKIVNFLGVKNSWKCCGFGLFSYWQLWFHEKNFQKNLGWKTCENVGVLSKLNFRTKIWFLE